MRIVYANGNYFETFPKHSGEQQKDVFDGPKPSVCFRPWWDMMEDNLMYFFVIMSMLGWSPSIDTAMLLTTTRYGDTAHDIPLQHSSGLHHPSLSLAKLVPWLQDSSPHEVCSELRQEVLLRDPHLALPTLPPLHSPAGSHGLNCLWENIYWVSDIVVIRALLSLHTHIECSTLRKGWSSFILYS